MRLRFLDVVYAFQYHRNSNTYHSQPIIAEELAEFCNIIEALKHLLWRHKIDFGIVMLRRAVLTTECIGRTMKQQQLRYFKHTRKFGNILHNNFIQLI